VAEFLSWTRSGGYCDRKRSDAIETLEMAAELSRCGASPSMRTEAPMTGLVRALSSSIACSPFGEFHPDLPPAETVALAARFLGKPFEETRRLASILGAVHDLALARNPTMRGAEIDEELRPMCSVEPSNGIEERLAVIGELERNLLARPPSGAETEAAPDVDVYLGWLMVLDEPNDVLDGSWVGLPDRLQEHDPDRYRRLRLTARLWRLFDLLVEEMDVEPRLDLLQEFVDDFRRDRGLDEPEAMTSWLVARDLTSSDLVDMLASWYRFEKLVENYNLAVLGVTPADDTTWWLFDALLLAGTYADARRLLELPPDARASAAVLPKDDKEAFRRGFLTGLDSASAELEELGRIGQPVGSRGGRERDAA
jgi:hypothetical protein